MPSTRSTAKPSLSDLHRLDGRVALVPGGAGYLGIQASDVLAELGADVVIASRDLERCRSAADEIGGRWPDRSVSAISLDVTDRQSVTAAISHVEQHHGRLDILANFSWSGRKNSWDTIEEEDWDEDIEVSLKGPFLLAKACVPLLKRQGGVMLTVASMYGQIAPDPWIYPSTEFSNPPSYGAAKAGVIQLTRYLASFLAVYEIRVNCLSPGPFPFPETMERSPEFHRRLVTKNPLHRVGQPHEIKGAVALLCTDASSFMTGQTVSVDGGWTAW